MLGPLLIIIRGANIEKMFATSFSYNDNESGFHLPNSKSIFTINLKQATIMLNSIIWDSFETNSKND